MNEVQTRPVVVAVDGSESANQAMRWAAAYAEAIGAPLRIVHANIWPALRVPDGRTEFAPGMRATAEQVVLESARLLIQERPGLSPETVVVDGLVGDVLLKQSKEAGVVVVGTRGLGGVGTVLIGSTAVRLAAHGRSPLVVVREDAAQHDHGGYVLIGVDGSAAAEQALEHGFDYAARSNASVLAVYVSSPNDPELSVLEATSNQALEATVEPWRQKYPTVHVECRVAVGHAAGALVDLSRGARLAVVGSRGRGGFKGLVLGSVSQGLMHHAHCPVMVLPVSLTEDQDVTSSSD